METKQQHHARVVAWRKKSPDKVRAYQRKWKQTPAGRLHKARHRKAYFKKHGRKYSQFVSYRVQAKLRGHIFTLTKDQFLELTALACHYCGDTGRIGVDRQDNSQGYVSDNVVPCCSICNYMKRTMGYEEFLARCAVITKRYPRFVG